MNTKLYTKISSYLGFLKWQLFIEFNKYVDKNLSIIFNKIICVLVYTSELIRFELLLLNIEQVLVSGNFSQFNNVR